MSPATKNAAVFDRLQHWKHFRPTADHLFPTNNSLRWFLRTNAAALHEAGAVLKLARGTYIDPEPFRGVAISLLQSAATRGGSS